MKRIHFITILSVLCAYSFMFSAKAQKKSQWEQRKAKLPKLDENWKISIKDAIPAPLAKAGKDRRILVFYRCDGFVHKSIPHGNFALEAMGEKAGYSVTLSDNLNDLTEAALANYDLLVFNNTTRLKINDEHKKGIMGFIKGGKGIVGIHAGTDNFANWPEGVAMMGGVFNGHPWNAKGTWAYKNEMPDHILNSAFKEEGLIHKDEIYKYKKPIDRNAILVLLSLDTSHGKTKQVAIKNLKHFKVKLPEQVDNPVSWCRNYEKGRLFYTNFGHNAHTFKTPKIMKHLFDGVQFAIGDLEADARAVPADKRPEPVLAPKEQ